MARELAGRLSLLCLDAWHTRQRLTTLQRLAAGRAIDAAVECVVADDVHEQSAWDVYDRLLGGEIRALVLRLRQLEEAR